MPKYMSKKQTMEGNKGKDGSVTLNYPMLTKTNYTAWSMKMRVYMQAHGIWEAIEPVSEKVTVEDKVDKLALAAVYQAIPEDILLSITEKKTTRSAWEAIKLMCLGADRVKKARVQTLKTEFENLSMKDSETIDEFCMKLSGLVTNIRALGETIDESYVVKKILRATPSKFLQITSAIEQFGKLDEMSVEETVGSLKAHEERLQGQTENNSGQLMLTEEEWLKREKSEGQLLFTKEEWQKRKNQKNRGTNSYQWVKDKSRVRCFNCQGQGHFAAECRKPKRDKEQKTEINLAQIDDEPALLLTECDTENKSTLLLNEGNVVPRLDRNKKKEIESNVWYLDNGASNHMTGQRSNFKELDEKVTGHVRFGDSSTVEIKGKGSVMFKCKNGEEIVFSDVYFIPTLCNNIISLGQFSENGYKVVLSGSFLWVHDKQGRLLMKVKRSTNRLYKIVLESSKPTCLMSKIEETTWLWHTRLGHVNFNAMRLLSEKKMVQGVPGMVQPKNVCMGCLMSKQVRGSFPSHTDFLATQELELIHADLCGPIAPATKAGKKYFLLLVDDFSKMMWIYLIKSKDEVLETFKKFKVSVEKQTEKKIKVLRSDRGGQFCSGLFNSYCEENGIIRHLTAPYSPQQNGVVERRNRTVVAMARSLLKEMNLLLELWGEAARHAVYLLNRLPTRSLSEKTPYEAWKGYKPDIGHLRVFGCIAHMKLPSVHTTKLDDRSKMMIYLGTEPGSKACRLYDPEKEKVWVSRDVVFEETRTWKWNTEEPGKLREHGSFTVSGSQSNLANQNATEEFSVGSNDNSDTGSEVRSANANTPLRSDSTPTEIGEQSIASENSSTSSDTTQK